MTDNDDDALVVSACRSLPPSRGTYDESDAILNIVILPLDTRLTVGHIRPCGEHFKRVHRPNSNTVSDLQRLLQRFPRNKAGDLGAALEIWGRRYWNRIPQLRGLVEYFVTRGIDSDADLRKWAQDSLFRRDFEGRVPGLQFAMYKLLTIQLGVDTIKPDTHVLNWLANVLHRRVSDQHAVDLLHHAAKEVGLSARELDLRIWEYQRENK